MSNWRAIFAHGEPVEVFALDCQAIGCPRTIKARTEDYNDDPDEFAVYVKTRGWTIKPDRCPLHVIG